MEIGRQRNISICIKQSKTSDNSVPIPLDLIIDIFSRLSVKSIARCRCVSKFWASLLRRQDFTELFLSMSSTCPQILFSGQKGRDLFFFTLPQPQIPDVNSWLHARVDNLTRFRLPSSFDIRGLVHGLIFLVYKRISEEERVHETFPMICNPSTGQALSLPKVKSRRIGLRSLLGYDPIDKHFKVLSMTPSRGSDCIMSEEHQVLTLRDGKMSWRKIECCIPCPYYPHSREICINGFLYYPSVNRSKENFLIVCFEVRSEKFSFIKVEKPLYLAVLDGTLVNCNGKLGLLICEGCAWVDDTRTRFNLWVLEDRERQKWSEHIYLYSALWKNMAGKYTLRFVGVTPKNEIILWNRHHKDHFYLFYFNPEKNTIARVEIHGVDTSKYDIVHTFVNHIENLKLM